MDAVGRVQRVIRPTSFVRDRDATPPSQGVAGHLGRAFDKMQDGTMTITPRVTATPDALVLIERLKARHGPLMFYQSSGCCDGSSPLCLPQGEMALAATDVKLGDIGGVGFHMSAAQFEYWQHAQLMLDAVAGQGDSFSLESSLGLCFVTRSRLFNGDEHVI